MEKIYLSETIQEICMMHIDIPRFNSDNRLRQRLAAIIVSQAHEMTVLEELEDDCKIETTSLLSNTLGCRRSDRIITHR